MATAPERSKQHSEQHNQRCLLDGLAGSEGAESAGSDGDRLPLAMLESLLGIDAADTSSALNQACQLVAEALGSDKVDAFLHESEAGCLVAKGTSHTPMGRWPHEIGLNVTPVANGGRAVEVFLSGDAYTTGRADLDTGELRGITVGLGIRSEIIVPFDVGGERRGVLTVASGAPEAFSAEDGRFCSAVARWLGIVAHRAELLQQRQAAAVEEGRRAAAEELIRVLAHDLNNLIAPLKGRIDMIRRRGGAADRQTIVGHAEEAARSVEPLRRFVSELLDAERLEHGALAVTPRPTDLVALTQEIAAVFDGEGVDVRVHATEQLMALVDPDRLRQALENIVTNAVKSSPADGRRMAGGWHRDRGCDDEYARRAGMGRHYGDRPRPRYHAGSAPAPVRALRRWS